MHKNGHTGVTDEERLELPVTSTNRVCTMLIASDEFLYPWVFSPRKLNLCMLFPFGTYGKRNSHVDATYDER
jgi:hypothetical protein